jgi:3-phosphoshikimate 1-carboxyvinyltransferase
VLGLLLPDSELRIRGVGINPTRDAVLTALQHMGASITLENQGGEAFEPYADLVIRSSTLKNMTIPSHLVPFLIDEIPVLAIAAMFGSGTFKVSDAKELRVKESDRIKAIVEMVKAFGGTIREFEDGIEIDGGFKPQPVSVKSYGDHRIAMSTIIGGLAAGIDVEVDETDCIKTSFPNFMTILREAGLDL